MIGTYSVETNKQLQFIGYHESQRINYFAHLEAVVTSCRNPLHVGTVVEASQLKVRGHWLMSTSM